MKYTVVDGHCDTPMELWLRQENLRSNTCQVSLERAKKLSGYVQFYAFCTVWLEQDGSFEAHYAAALEHLTASWTRTKTRSSAAKTKRMRARPSGAENAVRSCRSRARRPFPATPEN